MNHILAPSYDVIVAGGGPSGAVAARLLALANVKVALFERHEQFSLRVGESLMPRVYDMLHELGLGDRMAEVSHVAKYGASFGFGHDKTLKRISFTNGFPETGANAYNVERTSFDEMLLKAAQDAGAEVFRGCSVQSIERLEEGSVEVIAGGQRVSASYLVDATGANTLVGSHLGVRKPIPEFRKFAHYAHFTGVRRDEGAAAGDVVVIMCDEGWFWLIPIDETRTSIGLVVDADWAKNWSKQSGTPASDLLEWAIARTPQVKSRCENAVRSSQIYARADFSYMCKPYAGPGYFLCGDSAVFIDPIFSAGVCLGMMTAQRAAQGIVSLSRGEGSLDKIREDYISFIENSSSIYYRLNQRFYQQSFREFIVHPRSTFQINRAMITILGGHIFPPPLAFHLRWRLRLFERLIAAQRFVPIVPHRLTYSIARGEARQPHSID